jgi:hypothetical protein
MLRYKKGIFPGQQIYNGHNDYITKRLANTHCHETASISPDYCNLRTRGFCPAAFFVHLDQSTAGATGRSLGALGKRQRIFYVWNRRWRARLCITRPCTLESRNDGKWYLYYSRCCYKLTIQWRVNCELI